MTAQFTRGKLHSYDTPEDIARVTRALRAVGNRIVLVPTMGALHDGHRELLRIARRIPNTVLAVSIFVNPLQFGPGEDLDRYPRTLDEDLAMCERERVELVFTPAKEHLYPPGSQVRVDPGPLGEELEGAARPGHFAGVLTVVAKLFNIVGPNYAVFGEKDYQQLTLIKRMATDLNLDVSVVGVPTVREPDGLALSSRNVYLDERQRASAVVLSAALAAGMHAGPRGADAVLDAARQVLATEPDVHVDYLALRSAELAPAPENGLGRLLVAARVGATRLIDNAPVLLGTGPVE